MTAITEPLLYDLMDPATRADPYPAYARLRAQAPVWYSEPDDLWIVSSYDAVVEVLRDPGRFSSALGMGDLLKGGIGNRMARPPDVETYLDGLGEVRSLITADPPDHTRLRRLVSKPFTPRRVEELAPRIHAICDELIDSMLEAGPEIDFVADFTFPLPVRVIAEMLGIPPERRDDFKRWSDGAVGILSGGANPAQFLTLFVEMFAFFTEEMERRRSEPGDDLISQIMVGEADEDPLTPIDVIAFAILLLIAGNETTTNLISNAAAVLFDHRDVRARLASEPDLVANTVEEVLRYDSPVQAIFRGATRDVELGGMTIPADKRVVVLLGSANRDEARFPDADRFDIDRNSTDHISFGSGIHLCLGAPLARLEARIAGEHLLRRLCRIEPAGNAERTDNIILRGFTSMPVSIEAR